MSDTGISFVVTLEEEKLIDRIVERANELEVTLVDDLTLRMDLSATHANGCPLDFERLLVAPTFDFSHDVFGIQQNMDRRAGKLRNCFVPRCARPEKRS